MILSPKSRLVRHQPVDEADAIFKWNASYIFKMLWVFIYQKDCRTLPVAKQCLPPARGEALSYFN